MANGGGHTEGAGIENRIEKVAGSKKLQRDLYDDVELRYNIHGIDFDTIDAVEQQIKMFEEIVEVWLAKPEKILDEIADMVTAAFILAEKLGVDLEALMREKAVKNRLRSPVK